MYLPRDQLDRLDPLERWMYETHGHLDMIEAGCDIVSRHVEQLQTKPLFETKAEVSMNRAEELLAAALTKLRLAIAIYRDKPVETDNRNNCE